MNYFATQRNSVMHAQNLPNAGKRNWQGKISKKERKYQANYNIKGETTLGIGYGRGALKIASANMDDTSNNVTINELDLRMEHANVDILRIQETHNTRSGDRLTNNYRYISNAALACQGEENEKGIGGVAILIKQECSKNIQKIERYSRRCIKITIETVIGKKSYIY